jgi:hypothetical protein
VGISQDYPLKTWTSKQPIGEILGYEITPSHPLKYPSKQGLSVQTLNQKNNPICMVNTLQPARRLVARLLEADAAFFREYHYLDPLGVDDSDNPVL